LDFRDINLYDILLEIRHEYGENDAIKLYMQDIKEQVHLYGQPEKLRKGMDVYRAIDEYLGE
jgi:tetrahydromethanopterin S-methyltransferase subunit F